MEYDPSYQTVLDVKGAEGIQVSQWVLSNLASRNVNDVHIQIRVDEGIGTVSDGGVPETVQFDEPFESNPTPADAPSSKPELDSEREYESPPGEPKDVTYGSRPHKALAMLAEYEDTNPDDPWANTQSLYDLRPDAFRDVQDLSAAISTLYNDKSLVARTEIRGSRGFKYRPTFDGHDLLDESGSPF